MGNNRVFQALYGHSTRPGVIRKPGHTPSWCVSSSRFPCLLMGRRYVLRMRWEVVRALWPQGSPKGRSNHHGQWVGSSPELVISPAEIPERDLANRHP